MKETDNEINSVTETTEKQQNFSDNYQKLIKKNNSLMLDKIPRMVCITMVSIVGIQAVVAISILITSYLKEKSIAKIFQGIVISDILTAGTGIIAIVASVWVGLNIYISLAREETKKLRKEMKKELKEFGERVIILDNLERKQKETAWGEFLYRLGESRYILDRVFVNAFKKISVHKLETEQIYRLIQAETEFNFVTRLYEQEQHEGCISECSKTLMLFEELQKEYGRLLLSKKDALYELLQFYLLCKYGDLLFYLAASSIRSDNKEDIIGKLQAVIDVWERAESDYKNVVQFINVSERAEGIAYILNTIGYTYYLKSKNGSTSKEDDKRLAREIMESAVDKVGEKDKKSRARYIRNLLLTYENAKTWDVIDNKYKEELFADPKDYKGWNNKGTLKIKEFEKENDISSRKSIFSDMKTEIFADWIERFLQAKAELQMSKTIEPSFIDPYAKLIQVTTYLYLGDREKYSDLGEAKACIEILNVRGSSGLGVLFAKRNFYEAIGDIVVANEINDEIGLKVPKNKDYLNMRDIYKEYLINIEKTEDNDESD